MERVYLAAKWRAKSKKRVEFSNLLTRDDQKNEVFKIAKTGLPQKS